MRTFILAEKPSVAKSFAQSLNVRFSIDHYENDEYVITNCIGHLYQACYPEDYDIKLKKWLKDDLPIIPQIFKYKVNESGKTQAKLVSTLLRKEKYNKIIIATDAGREGELIASIVLMMSGIKDKSNVYRFWCSSALTPQVIQSEIKKVKHISEYADIEKQGYYRAYADWLVGINITRLVTLLSGETLPCGRVKTAVLNEILSRENEVANFVPKNFFEYIALVSDGNKSFNAKMYESVDGKINTQYDKDSLDKNLFLNKIFIVENKDTQMKTVNAEKLLNLTALQKKAFKQLNLTPEQTLSVAQKLYEEYTCLSYPRTPSRVMGTTDVELTKEIFEKFSHSRERYTTFIDKSLFTEKNKNIYNDELLEDHHALIPLAEIPNEATDVEKAVFEIVVKQFFAVFSKPYEYEQTTLYLDCDGKKFIANGKKEKQIGWKSIMQNDDEQVDDEDNNDFSNINTSHLYCKQIKVVAKKTKPKPLYRFDTILSFMENPRDKSTDKKLVGLGTPATRAKILQDLIDDKYIQKSKKNLQVLERGKFLIAQLQKNKCLLPLIDTQTTTDWEEMLARDCNAFYDGIKDFVKNACTTVTIDARQKIKTSVGLCPVCHEEIYESKKNYYCSGYKKGCEFVIWKDVAGASIHKDDVAKLLTGGKTALKKCKSKAGKDFTCMFKLNSENKIEFVFADGKSRN